MAPVSNLTNSEWHMVRLNVTKLDVTLEIDDWISDPYPHNVESFNLNDNVIYLGGYKTYTRVLTIHAYNVNLCSQEAFQKRNTS